MSEPGLTAGMMEPISDIPAFVAPLFPVAFLAITHLVPVPFAGGLHPRLRLHRPNSCQEDWRAALARPTQASMISPDEPRSLSARMGSPLATTGRLVRGHHGERSPSPCGRRALQSRE